MHFLSIHLPSSPTLNCACSTKLLNVSLVVLPQKLIHQQGLVENMSSNINTINKQDILKTNPRIGYWNKLRLHCNTSNLLKISATFDYTKLISDINSVHIAKLLDSMLQ